MYKNLLILTISVVFSSCGAMVPDDTVPLKPDPKIPGFGYMASVDCALAYAGEAYDIQHEAVPEAVLNEIPYLEQESGEFGETIDWRE